MESGIIDVLFPGKRIALIYAGLMDIITGYRVLRRFRKRPFSMFA